MDVIDFKIFGNEMQYVEIELDPGEAAIGEAGSMMYMESGVAMDTVFDDGSPQQGGFFGKLMGAGKRLVTGESLFTTVYTNNASVKRKVAFGAPYPGKILPMDLSQLGGTLICQKDAFLSAARGVSLGIAFQQKLSVGFFGGEGFIMQKLDGNGMAFCHAGGTVMQRDLAAGETLLVDTGWFVACTPGVNFEIQYVGKLRLPCLVVKACFWPSSLAPATCGCKVCRSYDWPAAFLLRPRSAAAVASRAVCRRGGCWAAPCSAVCWAAVMMSEGGRLRLAGACHR